MYLAREMTDNSLPKIGKEFGGRDHSTVLHAYNKIKNMIAQDDSLRIEIDTIKNKIKWHLWITIKNYPNFSTGCAQV